MIDDSIGIDISKDQRDCHRMSDGALAQFPNSGTDFKKLRRRIGPARPAFWVGRQPVSLPVFSIAPIVNHGRRFVQIAIL